jgi:hypothetical protein
METQVNQDPYKAYQASIDKMSVENPEALEFERICYELFIAHPCGKRWVELVKERYLNPPLFSPMHPNPDKQALYYAGYKTFPYEMMQYALSHQRRITEQSK